MNGGELEKLRRERDRLKAEEEVRADFKKRTAEKRQLRREIRAAKFRGSLLGRTVSGVRSGTAYARKKIAERQAAATRRPVRRTVVVRRRVSPVRRTVRRRTTRPVRRVVRSKPMSFSQMLYGQ